MFQNETLFTVLALVIPNIVYWIVLFPGHFQADHQETIIGIATGNPSQWHSLVWGYLAFPFIYYAPSYACYGLVQIVLFVLASYWAIAELKAASVLKSGVPLALLMGLFPTFLMYNNLYCSDVVFSYTVMVITAMTVRIVVTKGKCLTNCRFLVGFAIVIALSCLLRKNGLLIPIGLAIGLLPVYRPHWRTILISIGSAFVAFLFIDALFPIAVGAKPSPSQEMLAVPANQIAYVFAKDGDIPQDIKADLLEIRSEQAWVDAYQSDCADLAKDGVVLTSDFVRNWLILGVSNPGMYAKAYASLMYPFWQFGCTDGFSSTVDFGDHDDSTFRMSEKYPGASERYLAQFGNEKSAVWLAPSRLYRTINQLHIPVITEVCDFILLNRALPFWVLVSLICISVFNKRLRFRDSLIVIIPVACVLVSLLLFSPIAHMRYSMEMYYAIPFLFIYLIWRIRTESNYLSDGPAISEGDNADV